VARPAGAGTCDRAEARQAQLAEATDVMGKGFLTFATTLILSAVSNGYSYGFDIVDITGMPSGTVYPALRRLEDAGFLVSKWESERAAHAKNRPRRKYYELTKSGRDALVAAMKRYRLLDQATVKWIRPKSSEA
jgi:PadR family transcriptional regulator